MSGFITISRFIPWLMEPAPGALALKYVGCSGLWGSLTFLGRVRLVISAAAWLGIFGLLFACVAMSA